MNNSLLKRTALLAASNLLLQLMGFAYRMALTANATAEALGLNSLIMQVYGIVVSVCISGLSVAVTSRAARLTAAQRLEGGGEKRSLVSKLKAPLRFPPEVCASVRTLLFRAAALYCLLWLAAAAPVFLLRRSIAANALNDAGSARTLSLMLVCIFMTGLENVLKSVHLGAGLVGRCAASELTEQGVRFLLVIKLLTCLPHEENSLTVFYIMLGMTASELVSVGFLSTSFILKFRKKAQMLKEKHMDGRMELAELVSVAAPASATALASTVFASAAALLLPAQLVKYGMSYQEALSLIGIMNTVAVPITLLPMAAVSALSAVLMPEIAARSASGGGVRRLAVRSVRASAIFGAAAAAVLLPAAPFIAQKLFGVEADIALFAALAVKAAVIYPQIVSVAVLNGLKKQREVLVFAVGGELYQLVMMLLLAPVTGIMGYAAAMISGEALRLACNGIVISRLRPDKAAKSRSSL